MEPEFSDHKPATNDQETYSAEKVRQGTIILRHRWSRVIFILGLAGGILLAVILAAAR